MLERNSKGEIIPFGSYIHFIPPSTTKLSKSKTRFEDKTSPGVFLVWSMGYGGRWRGGHIVAPLDAFAGISLSARGTRASHVKDRITITEDVHLVPGTTTWFPLIDRADYANKTLAGMESTRKAYSGDLTPLGPRKRLAKPSSAPTRTLSGKNL